MIASILLELKLRLRSWISQIMDSAPDIRAYLLIIYAMDTGIEFWTDQLKTFLGILSDFQSKQQLSG